MNPYAVLLEMKKMLRNMNAWLEKAGSYAQTKKIDTVVLAQSRLAPDMYPLLRQVQIACDSAKFAAARLTGKEAPSHPDTETTFPELAARIAKVLAHLDTYAEADFNGARERTVTVRAFGEKPVPALDYLVQHAIPTFFFHATTTYAILRHNGVDLGKPDYIGPLI